MYGKCRVERLCQDETSVVSSKSARIALPSSHFCRIQVKIFALRQRRLLTSQSTSSGYQFQPTSSKRAVNSAMQVDSSSLLKEIPDVMGEPEEDGHKFTKVSLLSRG